MIIPSSLQLNSKAMRITRTIKNVPFALNYLLNSFKPASPLPKGIFVLTLDVETANDLVHSFELETAKAIALASRHALSDLAGFLQHVKLPITLLCTGHALLKNCSGHSIGPFRWANHSKGFNEFWRSHNWFYFDPATDCERDPAWYFGDIMEDFMDLELYEIGSHTFSHFRSDLVSREDFTSDIHLLKGIFKTKGLDMVSHAYPYDRTGHLDILEQWGVKICRLSTGIFASGIRGITNVDGMRLIFESLYGFLNTSLIKFAIDVAAKRRGIFVWCLHPYDILERSSDFRAVIHYVKTAEKDGRIEASTMKGLLRLIS